VNRRLERGALVIAPLGAVCAIWMSIGLPGFPLTLGHTPSVSEEPLITQIDIPTASPINTSAPPAKHARPNRLERISLHAARYSAPAAPHPTAVITSPVPKQATPADTAPRAETAQAEATTGAPAPVATSSTSINVPEPPVLVQAPTITLPPPPQITELPQAPALPAVPTLPQLPLPPLLP
jgi:hypothetical protein